MRQRCRCDWKRQLELHVHPAWVAEARTQGNRKHFRDMARLNCILCKRKRETCCYCNRELSDQLDHFFHWCDKYTATRELYWSSVINVCSVELSSYLFNLPDEIMSGVILGQTPNVNVSRENLFTLFEIGANIWQILAYEKELRFY